MPELGWVPHLLAAFATANFASTVFSGRAKDFTALALAAGAVVVCALLGADWVVHPAAGMLIAFFIGWLDGGTRRWQQHLPMLGVAFLSALAFMWLGAGWLLFPLLVLLGITFFSWLSQQGRPATQTPAATEPAPAALPEQAGGLPVNSAPAPEVVPVPASRSASAAPQTGKGKVDAGAGDLWSSLHHDPRLPAQARAQLVALDYRTREAIDALAKQGQTGTGAAYQARAIREEYAPAAVRAYLRLPPTRADVTPVEGEKTGKDLLCEQLELLLDAAQHLLDTSARTGAQELLTNGRFLREKFGGKGDLKL